MTRKLRAEPLTKAGFAPFGDVVEIDGAEHFTINQGFAELKTGGIARNVIVFDH